ncbi:MAG: hypothetical protein WBQ05_03035 [Candidatus Competibacter denitrificans]
MKKLLKLAAPAFVLLAISSNTLAIETGSSFPDGYFKLTTQFREKEGECLEGNQVKGSMNGAAFMDKCQDVTGQLWKFK